MSVSSLGSVQFKVHAVCCWSHGFHLSHYSNVPPFLLYTLGYLMVQKANECCLDQRCFSLGVVESHRQLGTVLEASRGRKRGISGISRLGWKAKRQRFQLLSESAENHP